MKRFFFLLCACIVGAISSNAQTRESLEDSVVIGGISRSMVNLALSANQMKPDEKLMIHWTYAEFLKKVSREPLASFTDQELREILKYYHTDGYRYLSSDAFFTSYLENITKALEYELGGGVPFVYGLSDKTYGAGLEPTFKSTLSSLQSVIDDMYGEESTAITSAKSAGVPASHIQLMRTAAKKVMANLYNIYKITAVDYLSKDAVKEVEDFALSDLGQKYAVYMTEVKAAADLASDDFINEFMEKLEKNKIINSQHRASVVEYVSISREFPEYFPELLRPYAEMKVGDYTYQGETRDQKPYGNGKLTDKKGVTYEGNFKNGKRHGLITVTKPGKPSVKQYWIDDQYRKEVPVGKDKNGIMPSPYSDEGLRFGYGSAYDEKSKSRYQGVFIDGQLYGQSKVYEPGRTVEGEFVDGKFVNGVMTWTKDENQTSVFKGRMSGNMGQGIREWKAKDGSRTETHIGFFLDGVLEGQGQRSIVAEGESIQTSGLFAYGKQYGEGTKRREIEHDNGMQESSFYTGSFFADSYQGEGRITFSFVDAPTGAGASLTRCGVKLAPFSTSSPTVVMEGRFDSGSFIEGRITYSDGTWYEGRFSEAGLVQGSMRCVNEDGSVYQGKCSEGVPHGTGELHKADGSVFKGEFEYGAPVKVKEPVRQDPRKSNVVRNDELSYKFDNISAGYGKATLIKPAGVKVMVRTSVTSLKVTCKGKFRGENLIEGKVTMSDGYWLEGVFEDGILIQGRGKTIDKYRVVYEGEIKNGFPHGKGKCFYNDGTWFEGKFAWGNRLGGTHYSATGDVIRVYE